MRKGKGGEGEGGRRKEEMKKKEWNKLVQPAD